jgi:cobalt-precorrin-5B (C1)-methyltransferase
MATKSLTRKYPMTTPEGLRRGYTTGTCAAAAAKAAAYALINEQDVSTVEVELPAGGVAEIEVHSLEFTEDWARASVIKDAGDDPDITDGAEIGALVTFYTKGAGVVVEGGKGVGRVTKPGLPVHVGQAAINPVPLKMIKDELSGVQSETDCPLGLNVVVFVPKGEELAKRTLNKRLGIIGGISILGTTGIVEPISTDAWTDTISMALSVAKASGAKQVALTPGRSSEKAAMALFPDLGEEAFVQMGDHVGFALSEARKKSFSRVSIVGQFGKLTKIASGATRTHVKDSELELRFLEQLALDNGVNRDTATSILNANTAREAFGILSKVNAKDVFKSLCDRVVANAKPLMGNRIKVECILVDYEGARV